MVISSTCPFCAVDDLQWRIIRQREHCYSMVSSSWFRPGHCLVIPRSCITTLDQLSLEQAAELLHEVGQIGAKLDDGYGYGVMLKYQPGQPDNHIKQSHLHFHVFPRWPEDEEPALFPVPVPNNFDGFFYPTLTEVQELIYRLRH